MTKKAPLILLLALTACTTVEQQKLAGFLNSPEGQAITDTALNAANAAAKDYVETGKVDEKTVAISALSGASQGLGTLQATPNAAKPAAIAEVVHTQSDNSPIASKIPPVVAAPIDRAVKKGAPADAANEAAARALDKA